MDWDMPVPLPLPETLTTDGLRSMRLAEAQRPLTLGYQPELEERVDVTIAECLEVEYQAGLLSVVMTDEGFFVVEGQDDDLDWYDAVSIPRAVAGTIQEAEGITLMWKHAFHVRELDHMDAEERYAEACRAAVKVRHLPVAVITDRAGLWIGMTGAGTNLGWEVAEAFLRLGTLPPLKVSQFLARQAGRQPDAGGPDTVIARAAWLALELESRQMQAEQMRLVELMGVHPLAPFKTFGLEMRR